MNTNPEVSVIIPTYNRAHLIGDAVKSVLAQSFTSFEVIVVDDGSTDETSEIFDVIKDPRVIYVPLKKNVGRSFARNKALKIAKGKYIAFLDSDDLFLPKKLELQVNYLEKHPDVGMVYTHANCVDLIRDIKADYHATVSGYIYEHIAFFVPLTIILPTVMVRSEVFKRIGGFDTQLHRFEDTDMWRRISKDNLIHAVPEYTCLIRTHSDNSLINQNPESIVESIKYYTDKILSEDMVDKRILINGFINLYNYYIEAFYSVRKFHPYAEKLKLMLENYKSSILKISIVIPVYNGSDFLAEAIDSALAQTYSNIEILVVNDGSNDEGKTDKIIRSYGDKIRSITKPNGGVASALNAAIENMSGDYFSWLSHDDLYCPEKVEKQVKALIKLGDGKYVIYSNYSVFTENSKEAIPVMMDGVPPESFRYWLTVKNCLHGCTLLVPRTAFQESGMFDESLRTTQDYDLWFRIASDYNFVHIPDVLVKARSHEKQGSIKMADVALKECDDLLSNFVKNLSTSELINGAKKLPKLVYADISANMKLRGFQQASEVAKKLEENLPESEFGINPDLLQAECAALQKANDLMMREYESILLEHTLLQNEHALLQTSYNRLNNLLVIRTIRWLLKLYRKIKLSCTQTEYRQGPNEV